jgi:hypothetical protein|nr:MAG TPA: hypothetical protein [Caudoviricetes sp.]
MLTNTYVTVMKMQKVNRENTYTVLGTYPAHFEETKGINVNLSSRDRKDIDQVTIYIPEVLREVDVEDIVIRNPGKKNIKILKSLRDYQQQYEAYVITSSDVFDFGSPFMRHTVIGGK